MTEYSNVRTDSSRSIATQANIIEQGNFDKPSKKTVFGQDSSDRMPTKQGKYGTYFFLNSSPTIVLGTNTLLPIIMTLLLLSSQTAIGLLIYTNLHWTALIPYIILVVSMNFAGFVVAVANPGLPSMVNYLSEAMFLVIEAAYSNDKESIEQVAICRICNILVKREEKVFHCEKCEICVFG